MDIGKFLNDKPHDSIANWKELVRPETVSIILGKKGSGKSGLAYYLGELVEQEYELIPVVVNLPRDKQSLLPSHYTFKTLQEVKTCSNSVVIIDEGTTMIPAGGMKLEELVKGFSALSRQRNQIILFIFHASADAGSRVLRGVDNIFLKEPSMRQIQHGAKDELWREILQQAKDQFKAIRDNAGNPSPLVCMKCRQKQCPVCPKEYAFVDSEEPQFRGMLQNPLASFWSHELSCAWASEDNGVDQLPLINSGVVVRKRGGLEVSSKLEGKVAKSELTTEERVQKVIPQLTEEQLEQITQMDYNHTTKELATMCRAKGLSVSGDKKTLAARLLMQEVKNDQERPFVPPCSEIKDVGK
jgi:energy-coupling factor transporter ATP-binding protein EcfA2